MKKIYFVICLIIAFFSCTKIDAPIFDVSEELIEAPSDMDFYPYTIVKSEKYTIETNCGWVSIDTTVSKNGNDKIIFKCSMNPTTKYRSTNINIEGETFSKQINVIQKGRENKIEKNGDSLYVFSTEAGLLYYHYKKDIIGQQVDINGININDELALKGIIHGKEKWPDIKKITIEGVTNAMDYACIKQNFENVEYVDLSNTTIEAYDGNLGTMDWGNPLIYEADAVPNGAFWYGSSWCKWEKPTEEQLYNGMLNLKHIELPKTVKSINFWVFTGTFSLEEIVIPEGVEEIGPKDSVGPYEGNKTFSGSVFYRCYSLKKVYLPSTLRFIGEGSFLNCSSLTEVHVAAENPPVEEMTQWGKYMSFGKAFDAWNSNEWNLTEGFSIIWGGWSGEYYEPKTDATLYVPKGCKDNYKEWEHYFQKIIEE